MLSPKYPQQNLILAALPAEDFERIAPHLEPVPLKLGEFLYEALCRAHRYG